MNDTNKKNQSTLLSIVAIVVGMFALGYAAVPLYDLFCRVTGFAGTTQIAKELPTHILERKVLVTFNADISPDLQWHFRPEQKSVSVRIGEPMLVYYTAENISDQVLTGTSTYNVTPAKTGAYFNKVECFCFEKQTIQPGEKIRFPVSFFIDTEMVNDKKLDDVTTITLSYTFFKVKE